MAASEKFCLRWNDFESNIGLAFKEIREEKEFFDVTLACEDDNQVMAHKVILSACSPFFRNILRRNSHQHPLLYLKGVKHRDLLAILNFMYQGEVSVAQEELNIFLSVAEDLRVKGLTQNQESSVSKSNQPEKNPPLYTPNKRANNFDSFQEKFKRSKPIPHQSEVNEQVETTQIKTEPREPTVQANPTHPVPQLQNDHHGSTVQEEEGIVAVEEEFVGEDQAHDYQYSEDTFEDKQYINKIDTNKGISHNIVSKSSLTGAEVRVLPRYDITRPSQTDRQRRDHY